MSFGHVSLGSDPRTPEGSCLSPGLGINRYLPGKAGGDLCLVCDLGCEQWYRWMNKYVSVRIKQRYILMDHSLQQKCNDKTVQT